MKLAIVKPDHIGDLILSSAAIRAMIAVHPRAVLFVSSKNLSLAKYLFPDIERRAIDLPHLSKGAIDGASADLSDFEMVVMMRSDGIINKTWAALRTRQCLMPDDNHFDHQSLIDYSLAYFVAGHYDMDTCFFGSRLAGIKEKILRAPRKIGLSLGSGFYANSWPLTHWISLARELVERVDEVRILAGPAEARKANFIKAALGGPSGLTAATGGSDIGAFIEQCADLDLVVASDGGTAHLCSVTTPVLSVFGPSPFRRYAPFGRYSRLMTRDMSCSPCCQYATSLVNGCLTMECMSEITPDDVLREVDARFSEFSQPRKMGTIKGVDVYLGVSHIDRQAKMNAFMKEIGHASFAV